MRHRFPPTTFGVALFLTLSAFSPTGVSAPDKSNHEVWMIDQSGFPPSTIPDDDIGGKLYIFDGRKLSRNAASKAKPEVFELAKLAQRLDDTATPRRPHYITFNAPHTHAIISFVATGHVLIIEAATRKPVFLVDVGKQAHAAVPSPDETYILVANQNGKLVQRINTDYAANTFTLDHSATLNLADGTTPSGALKQFGSADEDGVRPDNAPILALPDSTSNLAFVTLRGGGLFVIDPRATPMAIAGEYTTSTIEPAGLLAAQTGNKMYFNSGGGGGAELGFQSVLYALPVSAFSPSPNPYPKPDTPAPTVVFDHGQQDVDSHGLLVTRQERYLWVADRAANKIIVVDTETDDVVNEIKLAGVVSRDPAPDILGISPSGDRVYATLRGPFPLTGNNPELNNAQGQTPGIGVIEVKRGGKSGMLKLVAPVSNVDDTDDEERADPHGLAVRSR